MWDYLKQHERFVTEVLAGKHGEVSLGELGKFHARQVHFLQHERLVHLIVTLFVATFALLSLGYASMVPAWSSLALVTLLCLLLVGYLVHYYRLENGVQRLYHLANRIDEAAGLVCARYDGHAGRSPGA